VDSESSSPIGDALTQEQQGSALSSCLFDGLAKSNVTIIQTLGTKRGYDPVLLTFSA
jgi:hypothetical protein